MNNFSYSEYKNIINLIKVYLPIVDFSDIDDDIEKFCVIRHDIEFSLDRALIMAKIEANELGISSTYTIQLRNNTYNAISEKNIKLVREIRELGHKIALHQNPPDLQAAALTENILKDIEVLENYYEFDIDRFAFHRCGLNPHLLAWYVKVPDKINCYGKRYFQYIKGKIPKKLNVYYLSDSNHKWKYGHPLELNFENVNKLQLLAHPFSWTKNGYSNYGNFVSLIRERNEEMIYSMNSETNTFPEELLR